MSLHHLKLKKGEDRRIRAGHPWIYSNEIDTSTTPLSEFKPGDDVLVEAHDKTLLGVAYINPHSLIAARLYSRNPNDRMSVGFLKEKMQSALRLRHRLYDKPFYRLVFSEADELPGLILDRFENHFVCQTNTAGMDNKKEMIAEALTSLIPETKSILLRNDSQIREHEELTLETRALYGSPPKEVMLEENRSRFYAPLWQGQKTGWFYDHRSNRARLKDYVKENKVLDVFSYLGGFAIQAANFGAKSVHAIDTSAFACDYIQKNAALNAVSDKLNIICDDAFDALKNLLKRGERYEVIVLDPPAFVKKLKDRQAGLIAYQRLNELALKLLDKEGILVSCSCSMHVSLDELIQVMRRAAFNTQSSIMILERGHQAPDHPIHISIPESDYLKALFIRKMR